MQLHGVFTSRVTSALRRVIFIATILETLLLTTHGPPISGLRRLWVVLWALIVVPYRVLKYGPLGCIGYIRGTQGVPF